MYICKQNVFNSIQSARATLLSQTRKRVSVRPELVTCFLRELEWLKFYAIHKGHPRISLHYRNRCLWILRVWSLFWWTVAPVEVACSVDAHKHNGKINGTSSPSLVVVCGVLSLLSIQYYSNVITVV